MHDTQSRAELVDVIRQVRARWRAKLALRGAVVVVAGSLLALFLSARGLEAFKFSSPSIVAFRVVTFAAFAVLALYWLLGPLMRRVSDAQVALYLEERDPSLEAAILSAVEAAGAPVDGTAPPHSAALVDRLVAQAVDRCRDIDFGRAFEQSAIRRHLATLAAIVAAATLLIVFGPAYLRHGVSALLVISRSAEAASPYHIDVAPGDVTVPRGSDQSVRARLTGFTAVDAALMMRPASSGAFERVPLVATSDPARFEGMLFHVEKPVEYLRRVRRRAVADIHDAARRSAGGQAARSRVPLPRLHRAAAAEGGHGRRRRGDPRDRSPRARRADDEDARRADRAQRDRRLAAGAPGRRLADRRLHDRQAGVLPDRAHRSEGRSGRRVAAVHDRRRRRPGADRVVHQARARQLGDAGRGAVRRGEGRR